MTVTNPLNDVSLPNTLPDQLTQYYLVVNRDYAYADFQVGLVRPPLQLVYCKLEPVAKGFLSVTMTFNQRARRALHAQATTRFANAHYLQIPNPEPRSFMDV